MSVENDGIASWDTLEPPRVRLDASQADIIGNWSPEAVREFAEAEERARRLEILGGTVHAMALQSDPEAFVGLI